MLGFVPFQKPSNSIDAERDLICQLRCGAVIMWERGLEPSAWNRNVARLLTGQSQFQGGIGQSKAAPCSLPSLTLWVTPTSLILVLIKCYIKKQNHWCAVCLHPFSKSLVPLTSLLAVLGPWHICWLLSLLPKQIELCDFPKTTGLGLLFRQIHFAVYKQRNWTQQITASVYGE